jgi:hypothetical protein
MNALNKLRTFLFAASLGTTAPCSLALNTWGTDMSDLWWNPNESGWGANIAHQQDVIFMTLFVYGGDGRVKWYVASDMRTADTSSYVFSGILHETTGPYFAASSFNPGAVVLRAVGIATLNVTSVDTALLTYSIDGAAASKAIERQTFRANNLSGTYVGAASVSATGCGAASGTFENAASFSINHSGSSVAIAASISNGLTCTYTGTYSQAGRMGAISGASTCSNGASATFVAFEIEASYQGFFARYAANYGAGCTETGRIGGLKR